MSTEETIRPFAALVSAAPLKEEIVRGVDKLVGVAVGDELTYTVTRTNTGNTTLANVVVSDALITPNSNTCASVAPGATCQLVGTYTVTQADADAGNIRNTAVVTSPVCPAGSTDPACTTTIDTPVENPIVTYSKSVVLPSGQTEVSVGDALTYAAFCKIPYVGPAVLTVGLLTFVFSTILGWSYYGERATEYLFGKKSILPYRLAWVAAVFVGSILGLDFAREREPGHTYIQS